LSLFPRISFTPDLPTPEICRVIGNGGCDHCIIASATLQALPLLTSRNLLQCGLSTWLQLPSGHSHLLWYGILHGMQVDISSTVDFHELQRNNLRHQGVLRRLQGNVSLGNLEHLLPSPSSLAWMSAEWLFSHILTPLSQLLLCSNCFPPPAS